MPILLLPTAKALVVNVACPDKEMPAEPRNSGPIENCTVPPGPGFEKETVNVTGCPKTEGFALDVTDIVPGEVSGTYVMFCGAELLAAKVSDPKYTAVTEPGAGDPV